MSIGECHQTEVPIRPYLRWAGSKKKLLPDLSLYWSETFERYIEPFAGSSCLFFRLAPHKAVLSDKNIEVIETHEVVRDEPTALYTAFNALPRNKTTYLNLRKLDPLKLSKFRRAVRFLYLNRNCFNGIFRTNQKGQFNVPWSGSRTGRYPTLPEIENASKLLGNAELRAWDFGKTLQYCRKGDFVYLDPPYAIKGRRVFAEYGVKMFSTEDLDRLKDHLVKLESRGVAFLVSYGDSSEGRSLAKGWYCRKRMIRRQIAGFNDSRRMAGELLISNFYPKESKGG